MLESNRIEFKRELCKTLEKSVVSFLNYPGGGDIYIGIDDNGVVVGVDNLDSIQQKIINRIIDNVRPQTLGLIDVALEKYKGKDIVRIIVAGGRQTPYYIKDKGRSEKGCFYRVGNTSQPMTEQMIENMLNERQITTLQNTIAPRQNLTFRQLKIHYEGKNKELNDKFLDNLELKLSDGSYNYTAYLLSDDNNISIKTAVYSGKDKTDLIETREYGHTCLISSTNKLRDRLDSENRTYAKVTAKKRIEKERINTSAMREAVINAIVHNDYIIGVPLVEIFSNRVVITSCGGLVPNLTVEEFFSCRSMPRNRDLMRVFKDMELVEQIGSGMHKILKIYKPSAFELSTNFASVSFVFDDKGVLYGAVTLEMKKEQSVYTLSTLLELIENNPNITISEMVNLTGKSQRSVNRLLQKCVDTELIQREGTRKQGKWIIIKEYKKEM